jgi:hypothetical protein
MAGWLDLQIDQGSDFSASVILTDEATGAAMNLDGYQVASKAKTSYLASNVSFSFTSSISNAISGNISLSLASSNTANIAPGDYYFDIVIKAPPAANTITKFLEGIVSIRPGYTGLI